MSSCNSTLKDGIIAYPAPLQLQCLLYLVGHLDEITSTAIGLLPHHIRHELLLLLPAVDVCQLEGISVTADLPMDEIWETLYHDRIAMNMRNAIHDSLYKFGITFSSWKEKYFHNYFLKYMAVYPAFLCPSCIVKWYGPGKLFYATYKVKSYSALSESFTGYQCFGSYTKSIQGLTRYCNKCAHFTPLRYEDKGMNSHFVDV